MVDSPQRQDRKQEPASALEPEALVRAHGGWMLKLAERLLRDRAAAEDAVQDALIRAINGLDKFEGRASVKTWLHRITVNTALTKLERRDRLAEQSIDDYLPEFDRHDCRVERPWDELSSVDEAIQRDEQREFVYQALGKLPDGYRVILQLRDIEGYDTAEVGELLGLSVSNVKVRLHRARAAFKKLIEPLLRGEVS